MNNFTRGHLRTMITWESIFPTPVMRSNIGRDFSDAEQAFFEKLRAAPHPNIANNRSADTHVLDAPEMRSIREILEEHINQFAWKVISADPKFTFYITQSWLNYTKKGQHHHRHMHTNSLISGTLYIQAHRKVDSICFHRQSASQQQILVESEQLNEYNTPVMSYSVGAGDLIFFPSNVLHSVDAVDDDRTRVSLAFNTFVRGELGSEERLNSLNV